MHLMPVNLNVSIPIGATGAVGTITGIGVSAVTRLSAGVYRIQLQDVYYSLTSFNANFQSPVAGSSVPSGSLITNTIYQITAVGTTNWQTAGLPTGVTAAVGQVFKAATTSAGTGTAKALGTCGISHVEQSGIMENPAPSAQAGGAYIIITCYAATDASTTTMIATDPADGSTLNVTIELNNSSVQ